MWHTKVMMLTIMTFIVKTWERVFAFLMRTPYILIGLVLFLIVFSFWKSCKPIPRQPEIDLNNIQRQTTNIQKEADAGLANRLSNIDQRRSDADRQVANVKSNRNVTAKELEEKLK